MTVSQPGTTMMARIPAVATARLVAMFLLSSGCQLYRVDIETVASDPAALASVRQISVERTREHRDRLSDTLHAAVARDTGTRFDWYHPMLGDPVIPHLASFRHT